MCDTSSSSTSNTGLTSKLGEIDGHYVRGNFAMRIEDYVAQAPKVKRYGPDTFLALAEHSDSNGIRGEYPVTLQSRDFLVKLGDRVSLGGGDYTLVEKVTHVRDATMR